MFLKDAIGLFTRSIPRQILVALLSIYLTTYFATAIVVYSGVRASMLESDAAALNHLADLKYDQLGNQIAALATDLTGWSELNVMNDLASGDIDKRVAQALEAAKRLYGLAGEIYAFDAKGTLLASLHERQYRRGYGANTFAMAETAAGACSSRQYQGSDDGGSDHRTRNSCLRNL